MKLIFVLVTFYKFTAEIQVIFIQTWATCCEILGDMSPERQASLIGWAYDDMCHLKPYSENPLQSEQTEVTRMFADLPGKGRIKIHSFIRILS